MGCSTAIAEGLSVEICPPIEKSMLIRRIVIENVRSFLDRREMLFDGPISIIIGPNGGGKTNLLDTVFTMLRRYLFATPYLTQVSDGSANTKYELRHNDQLDQMVFEKHSGGADREQLVEIEVEVSESDVVNMVSMRAEAPEILKKSKRIFTSDPWLAVQEWNLDGIKAGDRLSYEWKNGSLQPPPQEHARHFLQYLKLYEFDNAMRAEVKKAPLQMSMVYLPVNRASGGFPSSVSLANYNDTDQKRSLDATSSRTGGSIIALAVGRLAQKYRLLETDNNKSARKKFYEDENLKALSADLLELGYEWELTTINAFTNQYDITIKKQGSSFLVSAASSGERELLTYLFAIYALNIRDTVIIVDEPEMHLHPSWQTSLFNLFVKLAASTGNQFVLATHSPTFITPASIQYVSRVYIQDQKSNIVRLDASGLPNAKHLFNLVNSQNNESIFFTDRVVLVEGISDRIFFKRVFEVLFAEAGRQQDHRIEIVSVGGKGFFPAYKKLLDACKVKSALIADLDYIEQIGKPTLKDLFRINAGEIKREVLENMSSLDGAALVQHIEEALQTGDWSHAKNTWEYIKSRRVMLKENLSKEERVLLGRFINRERKREVFVLKLGALEDYLPAGYRSKDLEKLIDFVRSENFWDDLPRPARNEIEKIGRALLAGG